MRGKRETAKATFDILTLWKIPRSGTGWPIGRTIRAGRDPPLPLPRARQGTAGAHSHPGQRDSVPLARDGGAHHLDHPGSPFRSCARQRGRHAAILRRQPSQPHDRWPAGSRAAFGAALFASHAGGLRRHCLRLRLRRLTASQEPREGLSRVPHTSRVRPPRSHHFSTRSARRVFQRLGSPRRSSSKYVLPL